MTTFLAAAAWAQEATASKEPVVSVAGTEDFEVRWYTPREHLADFPDSHGHVADYGEQVNRLTLLGSSKWGTLFAQIDEVTLFGDRYFLNDVSMCESQLVRPTTGDLACHTRYVNLEKVAWTQQFGGGNVTLGDAYASFGRGMAVDLDRNVDIDLDTSVRGVKAVFRPGAWDVTVFAGVLNRQQVAQDNPNALKNLAALPPGSERPAGPGISPDRMHGVAGLRLDRYGIGHVNAGAHVVVWDFVEAPGLEGLGELGSPDVIVPGASIEAIDVAGADLFVEADAFVYPTAAAWGGADPRTGHALYGTATLYPGRTVWLFEGKWYRDADYLNHPTGSELYRVAAPPTLAYERVITEDSSAEVASMNTLGGRVRVDLIPSGPALPDVTRSTPYLAVAVLRDLDTGGLHFNAVPETIVHPVIGMEVLSGHRVFAFNAGARADLRDDLQANGMDRQLHLDFDVKNPILGEWFTAISASGEAFAWGNNGALQQQDYVEIESSITAQRGSELALVWYTDYSSNPLVSSVGNLADRVYGAFEVQVKPTDAWTVKAFFGSYKAGIRCSGGQCRQLPGFEGARVAVTGSF